MRSVIRLALCVAGLAISVYLTMVHYDSHVPLVCSTQGIIDCEGVLTSPQSSVLGLPVALYGVVWFLVMGGLVLADMRQQAPEWLADASLGWTLVGVASVAYLLYAELGLVGRICLWCTSVHLIVLVLFLMQALQPRTT